MLGAIIGDIVGSTRERHNIKTEDFELVPKGSRFPPDLLDINDRFEAFISRPLHQSYFVGRELFAGEYPGDKNGESAEVTLKRMHRFAVRHFI